MRAKRLTPGDPLPILQRRFVEEYQVDFNASAAAMRAGYSRKTHRISGHSLLKNPVIQAEIEKGIADNLKKVGIRKERVLEELARIGLFDARTLFTPEGTLKDPGQWDDGAAATIAGVDITEIMSGGSKSKTLEGYNKKVKLNPKIEALSLLAKLVGYINEPRAEAKVVVMLQASNVDKPLDAGISIKTTDIPRKTRGEETEEIEYNPDYERLE